MIVISSEEVVQVTRWLRIVADHDVRLDLNRLAQLEPTTWSDDAWMIFAWDGRHALLELAAVFPRSLGAADARQLDGSRK